MKYKHLIVECYCGEPKDAQKYPCEDTFHIGVHCFECPKFSYTYCPNEIAISNEKGIIENFDDLIGFGGVMETDDDAINEARIHLWREICRKKIGEAYAEYMKQIIAEK